MIGVILAHPHGQAYGYPFVTPRTRTMVASARRYRERTGGHLLADRLDAELADGSRVVTSSAHWVAFVPFTARWPIEVHLYPRRPVSDLPALDTAARDDFPQTSPGLRAALSVGDTEPGGMFAPPWPEAFYDQVLRAPNGWSLHDYWYRVSCPRLVYRDGERCAVVISWLCLSVPKRGQVRVARGGRGCCRRGL